MSPSSPPKDAVPVIVPPRAVNLAANSFASSVLKP